MVRGLAGRLCGTDVSTASIEQARLRNPSVEYEIYDGEVLSYSDSSFDCATAICVMHHVPPEKWLGFLNEILRVVRPGGLVCIIEHNPFNPLTRFAVARCVFDQDAVLLRAGQTQRLMAEAGLKNVDTHYFLLLPSAAAPVRRIERSLRRLPFGAQYATWGIA
jgi:ubiquinone/menaquinone biosynthesis C-methylase UbiE